MNTFLDTLLRIVMKPFLLNLISVAGLMVVIFGVLLQPLGGTRLLTRSIATVVGTALLVLPVLIKKKEKQ